MFKQINLDSCSTCPYNDICMTYDYATRYNVVSTIINNAIDETARRSDHDIANIRLSKNESWNYFHIVHLSSMAISNAVWEGKSYVPSRLIDVNTEIASCKAMKLVAPYNSSPAITWLIDWQAKLQRIAFTDPNNQEGKLRTNSIKRVENSAKREPTQYSINNPRRSRY